MIVLLIGLAVGVDYSLFYLKREREERAAGRERAGRARGRRRDLRPRRAHLRPDRDGRDGRHALHRRQDVHGLRRRDDDRRRGRRARLAHRPAGAARRARRQGRQAARPVPAPAQPLGRRRPDLERDPRPRPAPPARLGRRSPAGSCSRSPRRRCTCTSPSPASNTLPQNLSVDQDLQQAAEGVPRRGELRPGARQDRRRAQPGGHDGDRRPASARRSRPGSSPRRPTSTTATTARSRVVSLAMQGDGVDDKALAALHDAAQRRSSPRPSASSTAPTSASPAAPASEKDSNGQMKHAAPFVFAFVLTLAFLLMLVTFRSIVIAIKAVVLNLLSVAAAYGVLVLVFQHGWGKGLLGFDHTGRDHRLPADLPVRDPVRALDGLPRVHPQPDPRGVRPRHDRPRRPSRTGSSRPPASSPAPRS